MVIYENNKEIDSLAEIERLCFRWFCKCTQIKNASSEKTWQKSPNAYHYIEHVDALENAYYPDFYLKNDEN